MKGIGSDGKMIKLQIIHYCQTFSNIEAKQIGQFLKMVYPTSITVKQHREHVKVDNAYAYYGDKALLSALADPNPPLLAGSEM